MPLLTNFEIDESVCFAGGGYKELWKDFAQPYYYAVPDSVLNEPRYAINWENPLTVERLRTSDLPGRMRSGPYLEQALAAVEAVVGPAVVSAFDIYYTESNSTVTTYLVSLGGIVAYDTVYDLAVWQAVGYWYAENALSLS